jgi:hypothetical protein
VVLKLKLKFKVSHGPLKSVCSRMPSTPPRAWIMSVR